MAGPTATQTQIKNENQAARPTIGHMRSCNLLTIRVERHGQRVLQTLVVDDTLDGHVLEQPGMEEQRAPHYGCAVTLAVG